MSRPRTRLTQAKKLDAALRERKMAMRALARKLLGPNATKDEVDSKRSQISKWRNGPGGISDLNAWALADALGYPLDHFTKPRETRTLRDELLTVQEEQAKQARALAAMRREVTALRKSRTVTDERKERKTG